MADTCRSGAALRADRKFIHTIKPGEKLTITFRPLRDGEKGGPFVSGKRPNGEVFSMMGGAITEP